MPTTTTTPLDLRAAVLRAYAHLLGPDVTLASDPEVMKELASWLRVLGDEAAADALTPLVDGPRLDAERLARRWVYLFDTGRIPAYESSNTLVGSGGHTGRMADVAGFYAAFGMRAGGDRPDHVVAELEFVAHATLLEHQARVDGRPEDAEVVADAARSFLRDHLGGWIDAFAARVEAAGEAPWVALTVSLASFIASEARRRNVLPIRADAAFPGVVPDLPDDDDPLACSDEPPDDIV